MYHTAFSFGFQENKILAADENYDYLALTNVCVLPSLTVVFAYIHVCLGVLDTQILLLKCCLCVQCVCSWHAIIVDGHSVEELCKALSQPRHQPTAIIAKTVKGKGIPGIYLSRKI